jgi:hypothetical protein
MEHIGAGLAALGVFGPGIGIGILAGLSAQAIGRNPGDRRGPARDLHQVIDRAPEKRLWIFWPSCPASGTRPMR